MLTSLLECTGYMLSDILKEVKGPCFVDEVANAFQNCYIKPKANPFPNFLYMGEQDLD